MNRKQDTDAAIMRSETESSMIRNRRCPCCGSEVKRHGPRSQLLVTCTRIGCGFLISRDRLKRGLDGYDERLGYAWTVIE